MKTGWLGIITGACFVGAVVLFLFTEGVFLSPGTVSTQSTANGQSGGERSPTDSEEPPNPEPVGAHRSAELIALPGDILSGGGRGLRPMLTRRIPVLDAEQRWAHEQRVDRVGCALERVVDQARCVATTMLVLAPPVQSHAPPVAA